MKRVKPDCAYCINLGNNIRCEHCENYDGFRIYQKRYKELREAIFKSESGNTGLTFEVLYKSTMRPVGYHLNMEYAKGLCDIEGFSFTEDGQLILCDGCGNFVYIPQNKLYVIRFCFNGNVIDIVY